MNVIETIEREGLKEKVPDFRPGDTVRVSVRVGNRRGHVLYPSQTSV